MLFSALIFPNCIVVQTVPRPPLPSQHDNGRHRGWGTTIITASIGNTTTGTVIIMMIMGVVVVAIKLSLSGSALGDVTVIFAKRENNSDISQRRPRRPTSFPAR